MRTELTITYVCKHTKIHVWYPESGLFNTSSSHREFERAHAELCAECQAGETDRLRKSARDYEEVVETLTQQLCEHDRQAGREDLSNVSIFGYWRKTITQVLQVRTALRAKTELVEGQRKELARRLEELNRRSSDGGMETQSSRRMSGVVESDADGKRKRSVGFAASTSRDASKAVPNAEDEYAQPISAGFRSALDHHDERTRNWTPGPETAVESERSGLQHADDDAQDLCSSDVSSGNEWDTSSVESVSSKVLRNQFNNSIPVGHDTRSQSGDSRDLKPGVAEGTMQDTTAAKGGPEHKQPRRTADVSGAIEGWSTPDGAVDVGLAEDLVAALRGRLGGR